MGPRERPRGLGAQLRLGNGGEAPSKQCTLMDLSRSSVPVPETRIC